MCQSVGKFLSRRKQTSIMLNNYKKTNTSFIRTYLSCKYFTTEELLNEIRVKPKRRQEIDNVIRQLTTHFKRLPTGERHLLSDTGWIEELGLKYPLSSFPFPTSKSSDYLFVKFHAPTNCETIGSYRLNVACKPTIYVDLAVEIPKALGDFDSTPHYNQSVLFDLLLPELTRHVEQRWQGCDGVKEGALLVSTWLRHRGLDIGFGCATDTFVQALLCFLLESRRVNVHMSSYQFFRSFVSFIASDGLRLPELRLKPLDQDAVVDDQENELYKDFHKHFDVVFRDSTGFLNICLQWNSALVDWLKDESALALKILDDFQTDAFASLFMKQVPFCYRFEYLMSVHVGDELRSAMTVRKRFVSRFMDYAGDVCETLFPIVAEAIIKGLGNRIVLLAKHQQKPPQWKVSAPPLYVTDEELVLGISIDAENYDQTIIQGPLADSDDAKAFRTFWGEKSEMRKFDGTGICESVACPAKSQEQKRAIIPQLVNFIIKRHLKLDPSQIRWSYNQLEKLLLLPAHLQYTLDHVVQIIFEQSGKWPDDLKAVRKLKSAFYMQISDLLKKQLDINSFVKEQCLMVFEQYPSFALTCRLAKRWISSHMMSGFLSDEAIELMVAYLYLNPWPYVDPKNCQTGFFRFLDLLATFDWLLAPLIVNFNDDLSKSDISEIQAQFITIRPTLPPLCIVTPEDRQGVRWTRPRPSSMIVDRLTKLANISLDYISKNLLQPSFNPKILFEPVLDVFDVQIWLRRTQVPRSYMQVTLKIGEETNDWLKQVESGSKNNLFPVIDYDPVRQYLEELQVLLVILESFEKFAAFFYDQYGGQVIGVLWKPQSLSDVEFKISNLNGRMLKRIGSSCKMIFNVPAIVESFQIMGKGLVENIVIKPV
ncbi:unnamed protein product [Soboliphyme baturini]|uniref:Nucleolar protein 6 n=1 Tax=Soboliphyme baturini TaxID=241478 RepID=A0A183IET6_9BILA|nr:unnamed protein product [Soboliphyme baturini]